MLTGIRVITELILSENSKFFVGRTSRKRPYITSFLTFLGYKLRLKKGDFRLSASTTNI